MHAAELLHAHPDIVICRDTEQRITHVNPAFLKHFGGSKRDWFGQLMEPAVCGVQIGAFYEDRMYGHLHSKAGSFWVEWVDTPLSDGQIMSCGRVNPDRRCVQQEPPNGVCRRKNHMVHPTRHEPVPARQTEATAPVPENEAPGTVPEIQAPLPEATLQPGSAPAPMQEPAQASVLSPVDPLQKYLRAEPPELDARMPVAQDQATREATTQPSFAPPPAKPLTKILLAEDDPLNAKLALALLENEGCTVTHVEDGRAALEAAKTGVFDLVFMDMLMPKMDGLQTTRAIRALGGMWETTPILALTANAFSRDKDACKASGMDGFITKPISVDGLLSAKRHWTNREKQAKTG